MANITVSNLTSGSDTTDASSYSTASITPSANKLVLVAVVVRNDTADAVSTTTISGNSLTYVSVQTQTFGTRQRLTVFRAMGASPTTGAITINPGETVDHCTWTVDEFTNMDTSGTNGSGAIVQSVANSTTGATSLTVTLAAFGDTNNATYGAFTHAVFNEDISVGSGFTQLADTFTTNVFGVFTEFKDTNDTSVDASWTTSDRAAGVGIEIKNATQTAVTAHMLPSLGAGN